MPSCFSSFVNVSKEGTFGTNGGPWKYEERSAVANQVDKFNSATSLMMSQKKPFFTSCNCLQV